MYKLQSRIVYKMFTDANLRCTFVMGRDIVKVLGFGIFSRQSLSFNK